MSQNKRFLLPLFFAFFFCSGFAALLYQIVWLKYLNLLFGSTTYATAAVLSAFMFGLSLGSRYSARLPFIFRASLRTYGLLEIGIGLFALAFPFLYEGLKIPFAFAFNLLGPQTWWYNAAIFLIAFLILSVPTTMMGATLPVLSHWIVGNESVARRTGSLYAVNTAGAVAGTIVSAFLLIPYLGLRATISAGVILNLVIGVICYFYGHSPEKTLQPNEPVKRDSLLLYLYGISGMLAIGYEVLWTRVLVLHLGSSVYAYAIMLSVFLVGISAGSYFAGRWIKDRPPESYFGWIQIAWCFAILIQTVQFASLSNALYFLAGAFSEFTLPAQFVTLFAGSMWVLFLPTFLSGALFPIVVSALCKQNLRVKDSTSLAYSFNTIGGIFGAVVAGFILIPSFGTGTSLLVFAAANLALGLIALRKSHPSLSRAYVLFIPVFLAAAFLLHTNFSVLERAGIFQMESNEKLLHLEEDAAATISVEVRDYLGTSYDSLSVNGVNVAGTSPGLVAIQKLQGHIPLLLFGATQKKSVLHIGFGSGGTAYAVSLYPETTITVVELSKAIVRNADKYFRSVNHGVVESGKLQFIYFDGRSYLQNSREQFDVILSDSIHPRYSGNGSLYTKDYYALVYERLRNGGVHSQWIPLYSVSQKNMREILKAFSDIFPETYVWYINSTINPYIIVTGKKGVSSISQEQFSKAWSIPEVRKDFQAIGVTGSYFWLDYFLFGKQQMPPYVQDVEPHQDDLLSVEYESSRIQNRDLSWWLNINDLVGHRERIYPYLADDAFPDRTMYEQFYNASSINLKGQLYFIARNMPEAKRCFAEAAAINPADREPLEYHQIGF